MVQRLLRTSKYYLEVNTKSNVRPVLWSVRSRTIDRVRHIICQRTSAYYSLTVQRLLCMSKYYLAINPKSSVRPVLWSVRSRTIDRVCRTICQHMFGGPPMYLRTKRQEHTSANAIVCPH